MNKEAHKQGVERVKMVWFWVKSLRELRSTP